MTKQGPPHITPEYMELKEGVESVISKIGASPLSKQGTLLHIEDIKTELQSLLDNTTSGE